MQKISISLLILACCLKMVIPASHAQSTAAATAKAEQNPETLQTEGVNHFFAGKIKESLISWDAYLKLRPTDGPYHWQRGIALYYAERWKDGREQFESHVTVNSEDVENSVWHFLCVAREKSIEEARKALLPVTKDGRVPMSQVLKLFAGKATKADVLAAAEAESDPESKRNALCFAHLYLGLFEEVSGNKDAAKEHMLKSAVDFSMPHYMGKVAKVHCELRGWLPVKKSGE